LDSNLKCGSKHRCSSSSRLTFPGLGTFMGKTREEMQRCVDVYQAELAKLQQKAMLEENSLDKSSTSSISEDNLQEEAIKPLPPPPTLPPLDLAKSSPGKISHPLSPGLFPTPPDDGKAPPPPAVSLVPGASPLQSMASITNSLTNQPLPPPYRPSQRSFKAILPPITQEQFDRYSDLNTEELVRTIKEVLSQYSISQRLFGENVLGLSQGSVSDLLARPKQYHMLTQKGKEPFIRMKLFLEDEQAVHKLVASQYKIAPEKLMRTGTFGGARAPGTTAFPLALAGIRPSGGAVGVKFPSEGTSPSPFFHRLPFPSLSPSAGGAEGLIGSALPPPRLPGDVSLADPYVLQRKYQEQHRLSISLGQGVPTSGVGGPFGPNSIYEIAALTQELNTLQLTTRVREVLASNNIGQKMFGETILGLSQGSVSELLTKPKPWHMLSIKGREPFIRMHLWLSDPNNVEKLQAVKEERDSLKRRRGDEGKEGSAPSPKRPRAPLMEHQREALEVAFSLDPQPNPTTVQFVANELDMDGNAVSEWFSAKRSEGGHGVDSILKTKTEQGVPFDPLHFRLMVNQQLLRGRVEIKDDGDEAGPLADPSGGGVSGDEESSRQSAEDDDAVHFASVGSARGRSGRRKPLAPQWVNPTTASDEGITEDDAAANGEGGEVKKTSSTESGAEEALSSG